LTRVGLSVLAVVLGVFISGAYYVRQSPAPLPGTSLEGDPAPDFRLIDHRGVELGLADFRGKPVVLAFLYTNCPDVCKLTTAGLRQTLDLLGDEAPKVQLVGVTVDPQGDDGASVRRFLGRYDLAERMVYLTGPADALPAVWKSYYLHVGTGRQDDAHTDALFLIDKGGRGRSLLRSDFDPDDLAAALQTLIHEAR
jgi:protein SCO1/2